MLVPLEETDSLEKDNEQLLNIKLEAISRSVPLTVDSALQKYVKYPDKWKFGFDQIYMINLERRLERRQMMELSFKELGMDVKLFKAVDGRYQLVILIIFCHHSSFFGHFMLGKISLKFDKVAYNKYLNEYNILNRRRFCFRILDLNDLREYSVTLMPNYEDPYHKRYVVEDNAFLNAYGCWSGKVPLWTLH